MMRCTPLTPALLVTIAIFTFPKVAPANIKYTQPVTVSLVSLDATATIATLNRVGLDATALAAAGVNAGGATATVNAIKQYLTDIPNALSTADMNYVNAKTAADSLYQIVISGKATSEQITDYNSAKSTLATAESARTTLLASVFSTATANLTNGQRTALTNITNNQRLGLPIEYLTGTATDAEFVVLRDALATKRISLKYNESVPAGATSLIATWDAKEVVAAAKTALESNAASVLSAWNTAVNS